MMTRWVKRLAPLLCALCLWPCFAQAEEIADMTWLCEFSARSNGENLYLATDGKQDTAWRSFSNYEQYLQIRKPEGEATLSVLWSEVAPGLLLQQYTDGRWVTLQDYTDQANMPETFQLPSARCDIRLRSKGALVISELYIHTGYLPAFFSRQGYTPMPMDFRPTPTPEPQQKPLVRGMQGRRVDQLQKRLAELGYFLYNGNGVFASNTYQAVVSFQKDAGLEPTGIVDDITQAALESSEAPSATPPPPGYDPTKKFARTASQLVTFIRTRIGMGYIYGGGGEVCSREVRVNRAGQYPEYAELLKGLSAKWDGMQVYDCNGLFKAFLSLSDGDFPENWRTNVTGAAQRWALETGPIETMPRQPGIMLLQKREKGGGYMHTGVYIGNGLFVHARGHTYGVMVEQMPQVWTHWVRLKWLTYDLPEEPGDVPWNGGLSVGDYALVDTPSEGPITLRVTPEEKGKQLLVHFENKSKVEIVGVPEGKNYWREVTGTDKNGKTATGYVYAKELTSAVPLPPLPAWPVEILAQLAEANRLVADSETAPPMP